MDLNAAAEDMRTNSLKKRGRVVRQFRRVTGLDIDFVARLAGLTKSTLSKFERGRNDLRVDTYARLLDAIARIREENAQVHEHVGRIRAARAGGWSLVSELSGWGSVPLKNPKETKEWIADRTKSQLERREKQSFSSTMSQRYEEEIADLERRIAELHDLLQLETEAAVKASEAESLREKIKSRDSGEDREAR